MREVNFKIEKEFKMIPQYMSTLDVSGNCLKVLLFFIDQQHYPTKESWKRKLNNKMIYTSLKMDDKTFANCIKELESKQYISVDDKSFNLNVGLITSSAKSIFHNHVQPILKTNEVEAVQLEADLEQYNTLKKYIDKGVADDEDKAKFTILSNKLGYSNNNNLENNFNNTKTEDYVTTIRPDSNTINTTYNSNDNHISSNEEETEEDIYFQDGEDGFGEDRIDDIQKKIENVKKAELTIEDLERFRGNLNGLFEYKPPVHELDVEDTPKEEVKPTQPIHKPVEDNKEFGDDAFDLTNFNGLI